MLTANKLGALGVLLGDLTRDCCADLSPTATALLLSLHHHGPMTATTLAAIAGIAQPTAVRILSGLIDRGLVERGDRTGKSAPVRLTASGRQRSVTLQHDRLTALDQLLRPLSERDRHALHDLLDQILSEATTSRRFARTTCRLCDHACCDGPRCPVGTRAMEIEQSPRLPRERSC